MGELEKALRDAGVSFVMTKGALDKVIFLSTGCGPVARMMSELREGDHFHEFRPDGPLEVAGGDAYISKLDTGDSVWCVPMRRDRRGR